MWAHSEQVMKTNLQNETAIYRPVEWNAVQLGTGPAEEKQRSGLDVSEQVGDLEQRVVVAVLGCLTCLVVDDTNSCPVTCKSNSCK